MIIKLAGTIATAFLLLSNSADAQTCTQRQIIYDECPRGTPPRETRNEIRFITQERAQNLILCDIASAILHAQPQGMDISKTEISAIELTLSKSVKRTSTGSIGAQGIVVVPSVAEVGITGAGSQEFEVVDEIKIPWKATEKVSGPSVDDVRQACRLAGLGNRLRSESDIEWLQSFSHQIRLVLNRRVISPHTGFTRKIVFSNSSSSGFSLKILMFGFGATQAVTTAATQTVSVSYTPKIPAPPPGVPVAQTIFQRQLDFISALRASAL